MTLINSARAIGGAGIGALVGLLGFHWLLGQGFYALALPGAGLGLGCGLAAQGASVKRSLWCGLVGLLLGLMTEWRYFPFVDDDSFVYFIVHLHQLKGLTLLMIAAGGVFAAILSRGTSGQTIDDDPRGKS